MSARTWSEQQTAIFRFFVEAIGHLIVRARAGTGKTTTIVEAVKRYLAADCARRVVVCAFNKKIEQELTARFAGFPVTVKTLHAIGSSIVRKYWSGIPVESKEQRGLRAKGLTERVCGQQVPDALKKLVTRLHTYGREIAPLAQAPGDLIDIAINFECVPDDEWADEGWTVERIEGYALAAMKLAADVRPAFIDFSDMIFLPVRNRWLYKWADLVVVDEAQDMTVAQLTLARGICKGRVVVVGDDRQAIYSFRGADAGSLDRLKTELNAAEHGLTTTYRCGKAIVAYAARMVPDFEAGAGNPEGEVLGLNTEKLVETVALGDFVLSRMNAPLVGVAMKLLRAGKRTQIAGKQIGQDLIDLVRRLNRKARSVPEFLARLEGWSEKELKRASKGKNEIAVQARMEEVLDRVEMLKSLADGAANHREIEARIEALFTDDGLGAAGVITCSSVHRAKGLEADRVFVLAATLKTHNIEEENIHYVAATRAKTSLFMVGDGYDRMTFGRQEAAA